jgi:hypothetical protein
MVRSYDELISDDPAWPELAAAASASGRVTVLPRDETAARSRLEKLQVTTHSTLGALAHETGGLLIDRGWLRVLGCGHPRLPRALGTWNEQLGIPLASFLLVADDVVGGAFAINGGGLGLARGNVFYFSPDTLAWEDTEKGHSAFVHWAFAGDLHAFYASMRWPGWETEVERVAGDQALSLYPPPWTVEGKDLSKVSRRPASAAELWNLQQELAAKLRHA